MGLEEDENLENEDDMDDYFANLEKNWFFIYFFIVLKNIFFN